MGAQDKSGTAAAPQVPSRLSWRSGIGPDSLAVTVPVTALCEDSLGLAEDGGKGSETMDVARAVLVGLVPLGPMGTSPSVS